MSLMPSSPDPRLEFGRPDRLEKALKVAGVTSNEMAAHLGVSRTTISNYTSGRTNPNRSVMRDWALKTGVPLEWLERGTVSGPNGPDGDGLPDLDSNQEPAGFKPDRVSSSIVPIGDVLQFPRRGAGSEPLPAAA